MDFLSKIGEANGWELILTGMGTVFVTLTCIWIFVALYAKAMKAFSGKKSDTETGALSSGTASASPAQSDQEAFREQETGESSEMTETPMADDVIPKMAAAAAVSAYLKRRKNELLSLVSNVAGDNPWKISGRHRAVRNLPARNPWRSGR